VDKRHLSGGGRAPPEGRGWLHSYRDEADWWERRPSATTREMTLNPLLLLPLAIVALLFGAFVRQAVQIFRARRKRRARKVEAPNSHYNPRAVQNMEARERWDGIELSRVHEINREEVKRLLIKADALGVDAIKPRERQFLDVMLEISSSPA
jgi:hypothetical protein